MVQQLPQTQEIQSQHKQGLSTEKTMQFSVPQGSVQGAFLFMAYTSTFPEVIKDLTLGSFANDHSLRKAFSPHQSNDEQNTIATIEKTMLAVKSWMDAVCLKLNKSKTEFIYFRSQQQLERCNTENIQVINGTIARSDKVKYLGGTLDSSPQFKTTLPMQSSNGKPNMDKKHWKIHRQRHMLHISQLISTISPRILQLHIHWSSQKVNKCTVMHTKHWNKNDPGQKTQR